MVARCAIAILIASIALTAAATAGAAEGGCGCFGGAGRNSIDSWIGAKRVDAWIGPFESFTIGDELIRSPHLRFADIFKYSKFTGGGLVPQARSIRTCSAPISALASRARCSDQRRIYFTYAGGTVFPGHRRSQVVATTRVRLSPPPDK